jgi:nucleoside-diphosphate-sugar epimerase
MKILLPGSNGVVGSAVKAELMSKGIPFETDVVLSRNGEWQPEIEGTYTMIYCKRDDAENTDLTILRDLLNGGSIEHVVYPSSMIIYYMKELEHTPKGQNYAKKKQEAEILVDKFGGTNVRLSHCYTIDRKRNYRYIERLLFEDGPITVNHAQWIMAPTFVGDIAKFMVYAARFMETETVDFFCPEWFTMMDLAQMFRKKEDIELGEDQLTILKEKTGPRVITHVTTPLYLMARKVRGGK